MESNKDFKLIKQGAEAKLYRGSYLGMPTIVKERFRKNYRHQELDGYLTKERIKCEVRSILRCKMAGLRTPAVYYVDFDTRRIYMEDLHESVTVKDVITDLQRNNVPSLETSLVDIAQKIGRAVGKMHLHNIIHGDLTTSNMLLQSDTSGDLALIDFGLSYIEADTLDKGVDLYVLERAINSTHRDAELIFKEVLDAYKKQNKRGSADVLKKLDEVRARGRKRTMVG